MKKGLIVIVTSFVVIACIYAYTWYNSYRLSETYSAQAEQSLENGNYAYAIKGNEIYDESAGKYVFIGGYEQVLNIWDNKWAVPKPDVYHQAKEQIDFIIREKLTPQQGLDIFKQYFRLSNQFLPEILLETGNKLEEQGKYEEAKEIYQMLLDAFDNLPDVKKIVEKKMNDL